MCANITREVESVRLERPRKSSGCDMPSFGFATRGTFSAALNLLATRAALKRPPAPPPGQRGPWDIKPLDFSPRLYRPQGVHHKRQAPKQERSSGLGRNHAGDGGVPRKGARSLGDFLAVKGPQFVPPKPWQSERPQRPPFARTFPPICPLQERVVVATHGTIPKDKYKNPRPHDFRQVHTQLHITCWIRVSVLGPSARHERSCRAEAKTRGPAGMRPSRDLRPHGRVISCCRRSRGHRALPHTRDSGEDAVRIVPYWSEFMTNFHKYGNRSDVPREEKKEREISPRLKL
ncbi:putative uncharacterized protein C7orf78 homolog isoform X2 [Petromyzon marinus]|uniref:Uncharacterized protein LOC116940856 isoform X2 n=1 Tax=Petromyzon marinus TaxID=7757 RepID=A0AAJ7SWT9_PETMA|nr:uncharacterized protein LOC116940856 isoform X2 [Petromyzon marinus]